MRRFTIFTFLLTVVIVVVVAEVVINDYLPNFQKTPTGENMTLDLPTGLELANGAASVLSADGPIFEEVEIIEVPELVYEEIPLNETPQAIARTETALPMPTAVLPTYVADEASVTDFEDSNFTSISPNVYLREEMVKSAGFANALLEEEIHDGFLFKSIYFSDLVDVEVQKFVIKNEETALAKVYVFQVGGVSSVSEIFEILKVRAGDGLDLSVNETDSYGEQSFFMNDSRRANVAFLVTRIGGMLYAFSYPKDYHAQISNLVTLIDYEF